jgi:hypothetical protein
MLRVCLGFRQHQCTRLTAHGNRCTDHARMYEAARRPTPGARERGYDSAHQATRARLLPQAYGTACPRCGLPMLLGQALDLSHRVARSVDPTSRADHFSHSACNRSAGARVDQGA